MKCITVIPTVTSYMVPTPTTLVQTEFPINATLKWRGCYQTICFDQEKVFVLMGNLQKLWRDQQMTVEGGGSSSWTVGRSSGSLSLVSNTASGDARVPESDLKKWSNVSLARQRPVLFLQNQLIPNKHPHNFLSCDADRCWFESLSSITLTPAHSTSKPSRLSLLRVTLRFRSLCEAICFRISIGWSSERSWSWESSNWNTPSASFARICALGLMMYTGTESKGRKCGTT